MKTKKQQNKVNPIILTIPGDRLIDYKTEAIFNGCLYVNFGGRVYYFDNTTGEIIIENWKDKTKG